MKTRQLRRILRLQKMAEKGDGDLYLVFFDDPEMARSPGYQHTFAGVTHCATPEELRWSGEIAEFKAFFPKFQHVPDENFYLGTKIR